MNRKRARTGCLTCRARKIKCDETSVRVCNNCKRVNVECIQSSNESLPQTARLDLAVHAQNSQKFTQAGFERRRIKQSCVTCKLVKKRCGGERPHCSRCFARGLNCIYREDPGKNCPSTIDDHPPHPPEINERFLEENPPAPIPFLDDGNTSRELAATSPAITVTGDTILSDKTMVRELCTAFFEEIAPLRCLGFLHRPTFLQFADDHCPEKDPLLLSVCALATKTIRKREFWDVGCEWARRARNLVFERIDEISVPILMCIVLLHEHAARIGELRLCFMLSSMASRYTQALTLNLEYDDDILCFNSHISPVEKESRRRLMWACYILDTVQACGLDHLQMLRASNIRIQLPCDDRKFLYKVPCHTATILTAFSDTQDREARISSENQGLEAFSIRLYLVREQLLQYIYSHTDEEDPWRLTALIADLEHWKESLPPDLVFNSDVIAIRKEESLLSALVSLHVLYHQVNCLLYRCTIPTMLFPARVETRLSIRASADFLSESRKGWFDHACAMTTIFEVALEHRPMSMTDPAVATSAYNAMIIKWLYLTNFVPPEERLLKMEEILPLVNIDLQFLQELHNFYPSVQPHYSAAAKLVDEATILIRQDPTLTLSETDLFNLDPRFLSDHISPGERSSAHFSPDQSLSARISPDYSMHPLSIFSQIRKELPDLHAPDRGFFPVDDVDSPGSTKSERLWIWK